MGRHSAPDTADEPVGLALDVTEDEPSASGRHARFDVVEVPDPGLGLIDSSLDPGESPAPVVVDEPAVVAPPRSDLSLLRQHGDVRARCAAAVVVPIAVYFAVLAVIGRLDLRTVLVWSAVPLVTAGVLFGLLLDAAHRKYRVSGSPDRP